MQRISRAPVLSATRSRDSCWIMSDPPRDGSASLACEAQAVQGRRLRSGAGARARPRTPECAADRAPEMRQLLLGGSLSLLEHFGETPVLRLRERARLDDPYEVADLGRVLLVVRVELGRAANDLLV